ncbi:hypothetical protein OG299_02820 [Streptomyces sp. NBC_01296]|nr:hypothetical protein OG299_02820 [Streptomyces sp. NBC_01296]
MRPSTWAGTRPIRPVRRSEGGAGTALDEHGHEVADIAVLEVIHRRTHRGIHLISGGAGRKR